MDTRRLNRQVLIQRPASGRDAAGQPLVGWTNLIATGSGKVWANIKHASGLETIKAGALPSVTQASIRIRHRTDVTAKMRVVHGATVYEVKAVLPDEASREYVDLVCQVVT